MTSDTAKRSASLRQRAVLAWLRLARVYQKVDNASARHFRSHRLSTAQFDVLAQIGAAEGMTQQELAGALFVTKGNISQILDRMQQQGLVTRRQEGRTNCISLTEAGRRLYREVVPTQEAVIAELFSALSPDEQSQLLGLCVNWIMRSVSSSRNTFRLVWRLEIRDQGAVVNLQSLISNLLSDLFWLEGLFLN